MKSQQLFYQFAFKPWAGHLKPTATGKKLIAAVMIAFVFASCDSGSDSKSSSPAAGTADITLTTTTGETFKLNGPCGWAYAGGVGYVGANQTGDPLKTFSVDTNLTSLPTATTTYTITNDVLDESPTKITMHFVKMNTSGSYTSFDGYIGSGNLTLAVDGNKVTANLAGITLKADSANAAPYNHDGALSGTLTFYK